MKYKGIIIILTALTIGGCSSFNVHHAAKVVNEVTAPTPPKGASQAIITSNEAIHAIVNNIPYGNSLLTLFAIGSAIVAGITTRRHVKTRRALLEVSKAVPDAVKSSLSDNTKKQIRKALATDD